MESIKIYFDNEKNRSIAKSDNEIIGVCEFIDQNKDEWNIIHTEVDKKYGGQGIAKKLVEEVIYEANKNHKKLVADCSYAKNVLMKYNEK